jgi:hypothetical protein
MRYFATSVDILNLKIPLFRFWRLWQFNLWPRMPDYSWYKMPKWGEISPQNIPNGHIVFPVAVK